MKTKEQINNSGPVKGLDIRWKVGRLPSTKQLVFNLVINRYKRGIILGFTRFTYYQF